MYAIRSITNLEVAGSLKIINNISLETLPNFKKLSDVTYDVEIVNNGLVSLSGLDSLKRVNGLTIKNNKNIKNLIGLNGLKNAQSITLDSLKISTLDGLENLNTITNSFYLSNCDSIISLEPLMGLEILGSQFSSIKIFNNSRLTECSIAALCNNLAVNGNASIENNGPGCNNA